MLSPQWYNKKVVLLTKPLRKPIIPQEPPLDFINTTHQCQLTAKGLSDPAYLMALTDYRLDILACRIYCRNLLALAISLLVTWDKYKYIYSQPIMYFVRAELEHLREIFSKFLGIQSMMWIIALWGWFCRDVLPVTCCEHGPPSIATVHFSKFSIATNILFN